MRPELPNDFEDPLQHGFAWLVRLRWIALAGQLLLCLFSAGWLQIVLPWPVLLTSMSIVALSNLWAQRQKQRLRHPRRRIAFLIFGDMMLLTLMLYFAGGAHNPFTLFYILHIALVSILLPQEWVFLALGAAAGGFALLFHSPHLLVSTSGGSCCNDMEMHLQGMLLSLVLTASAVAYFVNRLNTSLHRAAALLQTSRNAQERQARFNSLATLAAGVAHELATPLGTIAVVSGDLEKIASQPQERADAHLIRQEVERCRTIIERLGDSARMDQQSSAEPFQLGMLSSLIKPHLPLAFHDPIQWDWIGKAAQSEARLPLTELLLTLAVLIKNAKEASSDQQIIRVQVETSEGKLLLTIKDEGSGMDAETVERLGEPFFTRKTRGMGLGLFLARVFSEKHHGSLTFHSLPGVGTEACLELPLALP